MRDFVCPHARLAVPDGLTHQPIYPLSPATADTAVAARETCAHRARTSRQEGDPICQRLHTTVSPEDIASASSSARTARCAMTRGKRFVYRRRPSAIRESPLPRWRHCWPARPWRSSPSRASPLRPPAPRLARALPWHALEHVHLASRRVRPRVPDTGHHRAARRAQPPERRSHAEPGRCATHTAARASGRHPRHAAARSPDRR